MVDILLSKKLSFTFQSAYPYPHIVIDNFIQDSLLSKSSDEMNSFEYFGFDGTTYSAEHQVNKFFTPSCRHLREKKSLTNIYNNRMPYLLGLKIYFLLL